MNQAVIEQAKLEFNFLIESQQFAKAQELHPLVYGTHLAFGLVPRLTHSTESYEKELG